MLSKGNAFQVDWSKQANWMNPPWELIPRALKKLREDKATALACLPIWPAKPWWRRVLNMMNGPFLVLRNQPIFQNQEGRVLYPHVGEPFSLFYRAPIDDRADRHKTTIVRD